MNRDALIRYLDEYLEGQKAPDMGPNGLQVEGRPEIRRVITGVSACLELFEKAQQTGADAVLVHHGIFWDGAPTALTGFQYRRVAALIRNGINLIAYHLPLDRHPTLGNNALAAEALGLEHLRSFAEYKGHPVGFGGTFEEPVSPQELLRRAHEFYKREPLAFLEGPDPVRSLAIVSGGAQKEIYRAAAEGYDAYITGEVSELVMNVAREAKVHFLSCGHYATEVCGIQALGDHIAERFGLDVEFVDVPNPV